MDQHSSHVDKRYRATKALPKSSRGENIVIAVALACAAASSLFQRNVQIGPPPQRAEITTIIVLAVAAGAAVLGTFLKKPKSPEVTRDDRQPTLTNRGAIAPRFIGTDKTSPIINWVGDRRTVEESSGGGKKGGGGSSLTYFESACHVLATGPCTELRAIRQQGEILWQGPITPDRTPSGSRVETSEGAFYIYWGESTQPVNTFLGDPSRMGINSRWADFCYIVWIDKKLGGSAQWQNLEYDITCAAAGSQLTRTPAKMEATDTTTQNFGVNYAHAIYEFALGKWPHGAAAKPAWFDSTSLENLGLLCQAEGTPVTVSAKDGASCSDVLSGLLQDMGVFMTQVGDKLCFFPIRPSAASSVPAFDYNAMSLPNPQTTTRHGETPRDQSVFVFPDRTLNYTDNNAGDADDGEARFTGKRKTKQIRLNTVRDRTTARIVANRRYPELFLHSETYKSQMLFSARNLEPGMAFSIPVFGQLRCVAKQQRFETATIDIEAIRDQYGDLDDTDTAGPIGGGVPVRAPDAALKILELPYEIARDVVAVGALRIRASTIVGGATLWVSTTGSSYTMVGRQERWCAGGLLQTSLVEGGPMLLEQGPTIAASNSDILNALNLSSSVLEQDWLSGRQIAVIGDEICFLRNPTPLGSNTYRLDGLVRGQYQTLQKFHPVNTPVFIFQKTAVAALRDPSFIPGSTIYMKVVPDGVSIEDCPAQVVRLDGRALSGPLVDNIDPDFFVSGNDYVVTWDGRSRDSTTGFEAGATPAGTTAITGSGSYVGTFRVEILNADTGALVRTLSPGSFTATYSTTNRTTDFGEEPVRFDVRITNVVGGFGANSRTVRVYKA